ncbi:hypothetical protein ACG2LH_04515 [Zhouia sp. PK063]|uniref:hypothetical protein n=1 Tax=Zhouia sp. PK063 TaxID=3373602 RepID=UPI0037B71AAF
MFGYYTQHKNCEFSKILSNAFKNDLKFFTPFPSDNFENLDKVEVLQSTPQKSLEISHNFVQLPLNTIQENETCNQTFELSKKLLKHQIKLLFIDGNKHVATIAKSLNIPYAYIKNLNTDSALINDFTYENAVFLVAFYPKSFEPSSTPRWIKNKTLYLDFFSKYAINPHHSHQNHKHSSIITIINNFSSIKNTNTCTEKIIDLFGDCYLQSIGNEIIKNNIFDIHNHKLNGIDNDISSYIIESRHIITQAELTIISQLACLQAPIILKKNDHPLSDENILSNTLVKKGLAHFLNEFSNEKEENFHPNWKPYVFNSAPEVLYNVVTRFQNDFSTLIHLIRTHHELKKIDHHLKTSNNHFQIKKSNNAVSF